jgi:hypothetical protein
MVITVNGVDINLAPEYDEYIELMQVAVVKPGESPVPSSHEMVKRILLDNYSANIQQHAAVRPKSVADKIKAVEAQAAAVFAQAIEKVVG